MMQKVRVDFEKAANDLIERLIEQGEFDAIKDLAKAYPLKVFPDAVGLAEEGRENLLLYGDMVFNAFGPRNHVFLDSVGRYEPVREWIMNKCQRAELRPDGFGDIIYQAADAGEIKHEEATLLVRSLLSAGVDTTVNGIGNAMYCLAQFPDQYEKLAATPAMARQAFEEALRFEAPVQTFFRTVNQSIDFAGARMQANDKVVCFLAAANRDGRQWKDPGTFDIERKPVGHMAFGSGIHGCVGQSVARLEGELVFTAIAKRVNRIEIMGEPKRRLNNTLRALESLPVRFVPK
jgi:cytochrome P450